MVALLTGLGGPLGFGENFIPRSENSTLLDIGALFDGGLDFTVGDLGQLKSSMWIMTDGKVIFGAQQQVIDPVSFGSRFNFSPFHADVDTRLTGFDASDPIENLPAGLTPTPGGNSQGSNLVWYDVDTSNQRVTVTWDDVGRPDRDVSALNAFQMILTNRGGNDFDVEFRYEDINWASYGTGFAPVAGLVLEQIDLVPGGSPDPNVPGVFTEVSLNVPFPIDALSDEASFLAADTTPGNTGQAGRWVFNVVDGRPARADFPDLPDGFFTETAFTGGGWGDPHFVTYDGAAYDFHGVGEFVLTREIAGGIEVQTRLQQVVDTELTVNAAIATELGTSTVMIDATGTSELRIDGAATTLANFTTMAVGTGLIGREDDVYTIVYAGADGIVNDGDERLVVTVHDDRVDPGLILAQTRSGGFEGLLGNPDGDAANDIAFADGTDVPLPLAFEDLYGQFAADWRVDASASLFFYDTGETSATFNDATQPTSIFTLDDLDPAVRASAEQAAMQAGLVPGTFNFDAAVLDFAITGDESYFEGALAAPQADSSAFAATTPPATNVAPVAVADSAMTTVGTAVDIDVLDNDTVADGDTLSLASITVDPSNGTATIVDGIVRYVPTSGFTWTDGFSYDIADGNSGASSASVTIIVSDAPTLAGTPGDDVLTNTATDENFDGLAGRDTVILSGTRSEVMLASDAGGIVATGPMGTHSLVSIERVQLDDGAFVFDLTGDDLEYLYRVYDASFARTPDEGGLAFWNGNLESGAVTRATLVEFFVDSPEFDTLYPSSTDGEFIDALYQNALRREPEDAGEAFWIDAFGTGTLTRGDMLDLFADSPENIARNADNYDDGVWVLL